MSKVTAKMMMMMMLLLRQRQMRETWLRVNE